jgi:hypothetical protein
MNLIMFIFSAVLFFLLTPGIILSLPPGGSKMMVAATHAVVFGVVFTLSHNMLMALGGSM